MKKTLFVMAFSLMVLGSGPSGAYACTLDEDCEDGDPCTVDACIEGVCDYDSSTTDGTGCDDQDDCTMNDACLAGECGGDPLDGDEDGFVSDACGGVDCDDADPDVHPEAVEGPDGDPTCDDLADNDCDGATDLEDLGCVPCVDSDEDGYGAEASGNCPYPEEDCNDINPDVNPGVMEGPPATPTCADGKDNDCDGLVDKDDEFCFGGLWTPDTPAEASAARAGTVSNRSNVLAALFLPVGIILSLRAVRKRK